VTLSFLKADGSNDAPRALITVESGSSRAYVPFPSLPLVLLEPPRSRSFRASRQALVQLIDEMVERVNLVAPAPLLLDEDAAS